MAILKKKDRVILHSDLNNFFASVETVLNPKLVGVPLAVCGNVEDRHGIVLAKNELAKSFGIKTTMLVWEAKRLCPNLTIVEPHHLEYEDYSRKVREIYSRYTDYIEPFGIDEAWLDVTDSLRIGEGQAIADELRTVVKSETGLTCSVGVSFNKVFAKLASDLRKPDATTVISRDNFKEKIGNLPVESLLYVGKATLLKLKKYNLNTIGDLAAAPLDFLVQKFGKTGEQLYSYANGEDESPVRPFFEERVPDSIGNSVTLKHDLSNDGEVKAVLASLCEKVSARLKKSAVGKASLIAVGIRDANFKWITRQAPLPYPSVLSEDFLKSAYSLFVKNYDWHSFVRSIGVTVSGFTSGAEQISVFENDRKYDKRLTAEECFIRIREKYGENSVRSAVSLLGDKISDGESDDIDD